uniref:Translation initiation factor IF2/IF5 domain-containing protein n=1 Tax=Cercocebus atys TaxID=9531 RepID=A0A2K5LGV9_CERAT
KIVVCPECESPETDMHVKPKQQTIGNSYKACGYQGMLDTHHKLCTFILKNPPENSDSGTGKKEKEKKSRKGKDKENGSVSSKISRPPYTVEEEEDDWGEDTSEEAQSLRMDEISDHAKVLILRDDLERTVEEWANILFDFVKKKKEEGIIDLCDKETVAEAEGLDVKAMGPLVLTGVLFKEEIREHIRNTGTISYDFLNGTFLVAFKKYVSKELAKEICVKEAEEESSGGKEDEDESIEVEY